MEMSLCDGPARSADARPLCMYVLTLQQRHEPHQQNLESSYPPFLRAPSPGTVPELS